MSGKAKEKAHLCTWRLSMMSSVPVFVSSERYRDLIEAADTIKEMKNSADNVRFPLICTEILLNKLRIIKHVIFDLKGPEAG